MTNPTLTFDREAGALYIQFTDHEVAQTIELSSDVYADLDAEGDPVGFEILHADSAFSTGLPNLPDSTTLKEILRTSGS
jgi:uncharacterized protein YuzE